jgi:transposase
MRHIRAVLQAQINKTDRNDARGMAQMMRAGLYRPVHVKTLRSQKLRMLLTHRKLLQSKAIVIDNDLRGIQHASPVHRSSSFTSGGGRRLQSIFRHKHPLPPSLHS